MYRKLAASICFRSMDTSTARSDSSLASSCLMSVNFFASAAVRSELNIKHSKRVSVLLCGDPFVLSLTAAR